MPITEAMPARFVQTFDGEGRSGKGTAVNAVRCNLTGLGVDTHSIDQGLKFRGFANLALVDGSVDVDSAVDLANFVASEQVGRNLITLLGGVANLSEQEKKQLLYTPDVTLISSRVGSLAAAHSVAESLLFQEVEDVFNDGMRGVLIDGRGMEKYGRLIERNRTAHYLLGWYFMCDPVIAARRSLQIFCPADDLTTDQKLALFHEQTRISDRNRKDALRDVEPMLEPPHAYRLDLRDYGTEGYDVPFAVARDALRRKMVVVDTSYTESVEQMTGPVVDVATRAVSSSFGEHYFHAV